MICSPEKALRQPWPSMMQPFRLCNPKIPFASHRFCLLSEGFTITRRRTNVQQLTCNIDLSSSVSYLFFSFVLIEPKPFVLKGKVLGANSEKVRNSVKKCENYETILPFSCCPLVFPWNYTQKDYRINSKTPSVRLFLHQTLSVLSLFFGARKTTKHTTLFYPYWTPEVPGKNGKTLIKTRSSSQGTKKQGIPKKQRKDREITENNSQSNSVRDLVILCSHYLPWPINSRNTSAR